MRSVVDVRFGAAGGRTGLVQVHEAGALRLRLQRGRACIGVLVNTGGGIVAGDALAQRIVLAPGAEVTLTSVAAEKVYRSDGPVASVATEAVLGAGASLHWLPQELILFDGARIQRRLRIELEASSRILAVETVVFGRLAMGETSINGAFDDNWDVFRAGRPIFADRTRLHGAIGAALDRPALGGGARAVATLLFVAPTAADAVEPLRAALAPLADSVESGVSHRDGVTLLRALARSPERLRTAMLAALGVLREAPPRSWG